MKHAVAKLEEPLVSKSLQFVIAHALAHAAASLEGAELAGLPPCDETRVTVM